MIDHPQDRRDLRPYLRRLYNAETRSYLHLSGAGETKTVAYAWSGTRAQAQNLSDRAKVRGEAFPYKLAPLAAQQEAVSHD